LGQRLRQVADQILDAEYKEVEHRLEQTTSPSIVPSEEKTEVPSEEKTDDVGTQNNSKPQQ
jgi:hypothetical protein